MYYLTQANIPIPLHMHKECIHAYNVYSADSSPEDKRSFVVYQSEAVFEWEVDINTHIMI